MAKTGRFRRYFIRGLAILLPTVLTIWLIVWGFNFIYNNLSVYVKYGIAFLLTNAGVLPEELNQFWINWAMSLAGFLIAVGIILACGIILGSVFGKTIWKETERIIKRTPILGQIYPFFKQITDFFFNEDSRKMFKRVVAVEFPRKGIWSVGLVTGEGVKKISEHAEKEFLTVVIATTPSPLTGFLIIVPADEVIDLDMSIEEAFRFIISAGLIEPGKKGANLEWPLVKEANQ
jgi:uncharacterized membrane protein